MSHNFSLLGCIISSLYILIRFLNFKLYERYDIANKTLQGRIQDFEGGGGGGLTSAEGASFLVGSVGMLYQNVFKI